MTLRSARVQAIVTLLGLVILGLYALVTPVPKSENEHGGPGDVATYQAIVARLRAHEPYYVAFGDELRRGHYALKEVFNWRTPLVLSGLAVGPPWFAPALLLVLTAILCSGTLAVLRREPGAVLATAAIMQFGVLFMVAVPVAAVFGEAWGGTLMGLSLCAFCLGRRGWGVGLGLAALFARELTAVYCVTCTVTAAVQRRWRETAGWLAGAGLYAVYYGYHLMQISTHRLASDLPHKTSWLEARGLRSLLSTVHFQAWMLVTPDPVTAVALVLIAAGIINRRAPFVVRATSGAYAAFFLVAGKQWDQYWGLMAWPAWALACGYGIGTIVDSVRTVFSAGKSATLPAPQ